MALNLLFLDIVLADKICYYKILRASISGQAALVISVQGSCGTESQGLRQFLNDGGADVYI